MLNPFFLQGSNSEQNLIQDLINEQLRMYGVEVYYLPRKYITEKTVIREVIESKFDKAYPIEAYVNSYDGYSDNPTILSKFGIQALNELTLTISKERFELYISPLIKDQANIKLSKRPKEGDLIYFPLGDRLFEIKYIEHEKPFYQLQKNYVYQLSCELFRYEDEVLDTGIDNIDDNVVDSGYIQSLTMVGSASTSLAYAQIFNGGVRRVIVTNRGSGYTSTPRVAISSAPSGGLTASGIATMISGIVDCEGISKESRVQGVEIINSGYGYTVAPGVSFIGGGGNGAEAYTQIGDGIVGTITLTSGGSGYYSPPLVSFTNEVFLSGVSTASASATAVVSAAGTISSIRITNAGLGYSVAPTIVIESPYNTGIGTFTFNEIVTGSISSTTAVVNSWNSETNVLKVSKISGSFVIGENIVGSESGASRKLRTLNEYNNTDPYSQNEVIEEEADQIIDFSEGNPFGIS